jgi:hypothetical protein
VSEEGFSHTHVRLWVSDESLRAAFEHVVLAVYHGMRGRTPTPTPQEPPHAMAAFVYSNSPAVNTPTIRRTLPDLPRQCLPILGTHTLSPPSVLSRADPRTYRRHFALPIFGSYLSPFIKPALS